MTTNPAIYVACIASYNSGILHGEWIEVTDEASVKVKIQNILAASPIEDAGDYDPALN